MNAPQPLFDLIDRYAAACAERERCRELAAWAFADAHRAMLAARAAVAAALGVAPAALPALTDDASILAGGVR